MDTTLTELQEALRATHSGSAAGSIAGGDGEAPGWSPPVLLGSGVAGVLSLTPADQVWLSGTHTTLASGVALNWMTQGSLTLAVAGGLGRRGAQRREPEPGARQRVRVDEQALPRQGRRCGEFLSAIVPREALEAPQ